MRRGSRIRAYVPPPRSLVTLSWPPCCSTRAPVRVRPKETINSAIRVVYRVSSVRVRTVADAPVRGHRLSNARTRGPDVVQRIAPYRQQQTNGEHRSSEKQVVRSYHLPPSGQGFESHNFHARAFGDSAGKQERGLPQGSLEIERTPSPTPPSPRSEGASIKSSRWSYFR